MRGGWREKQGSEHTARQAGALNGDAARWWEFFQLPRHLHQSLRQSWGRSADGEGRGGQDVSSVGATAWERDGAFSVSGEPSQQKQAPGAQQTGRNLNSSSRKPRGRLQVIWGL